MTRRDGDSKMTLESDTQQFRKRNYCHLSDRIIISVVWYNSKDANNDAYSKREWRCFMTKNTH